MQTFGNFFFFSRSSTLRKVEQKHECSLLQIFHCYTGVRTCMLCLMYFTGVFHEWIAPHVLSTASQIMSWWLLLAHKHPWLQLLFVLFFWFCFILLFFFCWMILCCHCFIHNTLLNNIWPFGAYILHLTLFGALVRIMKTRLYGRCFGQ